MTSDDLRGRLRDAADDPAGDVDLAVVASRARAIRTRRRAAGAGVATLAVVALVGLAAVLLRADPGGSDVAAGGPQPSVESTTSSTAMATTTSTQSPATVTIGRTTTTGAPTTTATTRASSTTRTTITKDPRVSDTPTAPSCSEASGTTGNVRLPPDFVPSPRCLVIRHDQRLSVTNDTPKAITVTLGSHLKMTVAAGKTETFPGVVGTYLESGVHKLVFSPSSTADIWVDAVCTPPGSGADCHSP
jgi:hypothetical protein